MSKKKNDSEKKARVHKDLEGFEIGISPTGQVISNFTHDQLNEFLNKHVKDKKLTPDQKHEQDDRMFPLQQPNDDAADTDAADEAFMRAAGLKRKKGKAAAADATDEITEETAAAADDDDSAADD